jgi:hypothetical protein
MAPIAASASLAVVAFGDVDSSVSPSQPQTALRAAAKRLSCISVIFLGLQPWRALVGFPSASLRD